VTAQSTVEIVMTPAQRRALIAHVTDRRNFWIVWTVALVAAVVAAFASKAGSQPTDAVRASIPWILGGAAVIVFVIVALILRWYASARGEHTVNRRTAELDIERQHNDEGADVRFVDVGDLNVVLDPGVPEMRVGAIEYTARKGVLLAIWDRDGVLAWCCPGYEPTTLAIDSMKVTG
jgi:hypothetical protein